MTTVEGFEEDCGLVDRTMTVVGCEDDLTPAGLRLRQGRKNGWGSLLPENGATGAKGT
jgi:hypothetical protein